MGMLNGSAMRGRSSLVGNSAVGNSGALVER